MGLELGSGLGDEYVGSKKEGVTVLMPARMREKVIDFGNVYS